jgi:hypothetical protein
MSYGLGLALVAILALLPVHRPNVAFLQYQKRMLFLHGMQSRYQGTSPVEIEAAARTYAQARGYELEVLEIGGDHAAQQDAIARARIEKGGIDAVYGFSAGASEFGVHQGRRSGASGDIELLVIWTCRGRWRAGSAPGGCSRGSKALAPTAVNRRLLPSLVIAGNAAIVSPRCTIKTS